MRPEFGARLPPATRVLVDVCRHALGSGPTPPSTLPAHELRAYAQRHGLMGFLGAADARFADDARTQAVTALAAVRELAGIYTQLRSEQIDVVVLKGPVFSAWLYGSPGLRTFLDLDLLIGRADLGRALHVLEALGYCPPAGLPPKAIHAWHGAIPLENPGRTPVDVHWQLAIRRFGNPFDPARVFERAVEVRAGALAVRTLGATDAALFTLMHAAKHCWSSLEMLLSIAFLFARTDVDWPAVHAALSRIGLQRVAHVPAALIHGLLGRDVPSPVRAALELDASDPSVRGALAALSLPPGHFPSSSDERRLHRSLFDGRLRAARYSALTALEPTAAEWRAIRLPPLLAPLYVPVRIARLLVRPFGSAATPADREPVAPDGNSTPNLRRS